MGRKSTYAVGDKYGGLEVLEIIPSNKTGQHVKLKCLCHYCKSTNIKSGANVRKRNSCGCQQRESKTWKHNTGAKNRPWQLEPGKAARNNLEYQYKSGAKKRKLEYQLTSEQFIDLVSSECYYCGDKETSVRKGQGKTSGDFYYNGIDRVDNKKGYIVDNCVPCCWKCNNMKHTLTQKDFIDHIEKIYKKQTQYDYTD